MQNTSEYRCPDCNQIIPASNRFFCPHCGYNIQTVYKGYNKSTILFLILFRPVGLYLMWTKTVWDKLIKILISMLCVAVFIVEGYYLVSFIKGKVNPDDKHPASPVVTEVNNSTSSTATQMHVIVEDDTTTSTTAVTTTTTTTTTTTSTTAVTSSSTSVPSKNTSQSTTKKTDIIRTSRTVRSTTKPTTKPTAKPTAKTTTKSTSKPTTKATTKTTSKPTTKPTTKITTASSTQPTTKPTTKPTIPTTIISYDQAVLHMAKSLIQSKPYSRKALITALESYDFDEPDAVYAADHCGADWNEQALKAAKNIQSTDKEKILVELEKEGFTKEQALYAVNTL